MATAYSDRSANVWEERGAILDDGSFVVMLSLLLLLGRYCVSLLAA